MGHVVRDIRFRIKVVWGKSCVVEHKFLKPEGEIQLWSLICHEHTSKDPISRGLVLWEEESEGELTRSHSKP
jgi:hypothetical protein